MQSPFVSQLILATIGRTIFTGTIFTAQVVVAAAKKKAQEESALPHSLVYGTPNP